MKELLILLFTLFAAEYCSEYITNVHRSGGSTNDLSHTRLALNQSIVQLNILSSLITENKTSPDTGIIYKSAEKSFHFFKSNNIYFGIESDDLINNGIYNSISATGTYSIQRHNEIKLV